MEEVAKSVSLDREDDPGGSMSPSSVRRLRREKDQAKSTKQEHPWDRRKVRREGDVLEAWSTEAVVGCARAAYDRSGNQTEDRPPNSTPNRHPHKKSPFLARQALCFSFL